MNYDKILECLAETLNIPFEKIRSTPPSTRLEELGFTSLIFIDFILHIEETFHVEILDSDLIFSNFFTIERTLFTISKYVNNDAIKGDKKVLILDADNVLWKGISGEENIVIDDEVTSFHSQLIDLYNRGVLLCLCSKNEFKNVDEVFSLNTMKIKKEHFVSFYANRVDKVTNIISIANELNLSLDSFVFVDDSDYELGFVEINLPEVATVKADYNYPSFREKITAYFRFASSSSDTNRTQLYHEQKMREKERKKFISIEEYNRSLETAIHCDVALYDDCLRLSELSRRTHQFNLSNISYSKSDIEELIKDPRSSVFKLSAMDKYGDMGIVGMSVITGTTIVAFILSCRVFGRDFEYVLLEKIKSVAQRPLKGIYRYNGKNNAYMDFFEKNGVAPI